MITKAITYFGRQCLLACDANCKKAWGTNGGRPRIDFDSKDPDDFAYLSDAEVGEAPDDPGVYEGGEGKPTSYPDGSEPHVLNKWCARECERSVIVRVDEIPILPDLSRRLYNHPRRKERELVT
jgi:hypothetical protein